MRFVAGAAIALMAVAAHAQFTLQVTSPLEGAFLGFNNQVKFLITNATEETTVRVTAAGPGGSTVKEEDFTPNQDNKIDGSITLNFNESSPSGAYTITVEAFDSTFTATPVVRNVTVDVTRPKILEFNPIQNGSVKGPIVPINVKLSEANLKEWRVKIDGNDIPNNTGTTVDGNNSFQVNWTVTGFLTDGNHTISISVKDKSENESTQSVSVRLDRLAPSLSIAFPRSDSQVRPNSDFSVIVDVSDPNGGLMDLTGLDVIVRKLDNTYLYRVPRVSFQATGSGSYRWTGRVRNKAVSLPSQFKIVASGVDKAGNIAVEQEVIVDTSRGRASNSGSGNTGRIGGKG
ncbi:MAG: hypothetical protein H7Y17_02400 [Chlorobia bacterium]|nr:hypothetical protein [Fimbriimonadaceae bacterium]